MQIFSLPFSSRRSATLFVADHCCSERNQPTPHPATTMAAINLLDATARAAAVDAAAIAGAAEQMAASDADDGVSAGDANNNNDPPSNANAADDGVAGADDEEEQPPVPPADDDVAGADDDDEEQQPPAPPADDGGVDDAAAAKSDNGTGKKEGEEEEDDEEKWDLNAILSPSQIRNAESARLPEPTLKENHTENCDNDNDESYESSDINLSGLYDDQDDASRESGHTDRRGPILSVNSGQVTNPLYEFMQNALDDSLLALCIQFSPRDPRHSSVEAVAVIISQGPYDQDTPLKDRKEVSFPSTMVVKDVEDLKFLESCGCRVSDEAPNLSSLRLLRLREKDSTSYVAVGSVDSNDNVTAWTKIRVDGAPVDASRYSLQTIEIFTFFGMSGSDFKMESLLTNHHLQGKYFCVGCLHCSTSPECLKCGITKAYRWGPHGNAELLKKRNAYTGTSDTERNAISRNIDGPGELVYHDHKRSGDSLHLLRECVFVCVLISFHQSIHPPWFSASNLLSYYRTNT